MWKKNSIPLDFRTVVSIYINRNFFTEMVISYIIYFNTLSVKNKLNKLAPPTLKPKNCGLKSKYAALHLKPALKITSISTLFNTTMTQAFTRIRILGDETVNFALLQFKLDREKNWLWKNSITNVLIGHPSPFTTLPFFAPPWDIPDYGPDCAHYAILKNDNFRNHFFTLFNMSYSFRKLNWK